MEKRELLKENKELMKEYDYEKNKDIDLDTQKSGSAKKIWWICSKGHSWDAPINDRVRGVGCPICSNHRVLVGYNDLKHRCPEIAKEWDYKKNKNTPSEIIWSTTRKSWWICSRGHSYETSVYSRTIKKTGCPYCAGIKVLKGFNDLESQYPEIAKEWDYNKNTELPSSIVNGSKTKYWFICNRGHSYRTTISSKKNGHGCPYCGGNKVLKGFNDLESQYPEIAKEWDYNKNKIKPCDIVWGTNRKAWWVCPLGHSYETNIVSKVRRESKCPYCQNKKLLKGFNDLETKYPDIIQEWNYKRNKISPSEIIYGSHKKVWWICSKGHEWQAVVKDRVGINAHGCPYCNKEKQISVPEKIVYYYLNKYLGECFENYSPKNFGKANIDVYCSKLLVGVEYDGVYFHKNVSRDYKKDEKAKNNGIRLYRIREKGCPKLSSSSRCIDLANNSYIELEEAIKLILKENGIGQVDIDINRDLSKIYSLIEFNEKENSLINKYPEVAKEWNYEKNKTITPEVISYGSSKKVWWKCSKGHEWQASVGDRTGNNPYGCPYCSGKRLLSGYNDFKTRYPEIAKEWNYERNDELLPNMVKIGTARKVWWKCPKGHEYQMAVKSRVSGQNCPICSRRRTVAGLNDLATTDPYILAEWNYGKNDVNPNELSRKSSVKVWWKCSKGHEWQATVANRVGNGTGCPYCTNQKLLKGYNDLATTHPKLLDEWDYSKNKINPDEVVAGTHKRAWWICPNGHNYQTKIVLRKLGHGCPICAKNRTTKKL